MQCRRQRRNLFQWQLSPPQRTSQRQQWAKLAEWMLRRL